MIIYRTAAAFCLALELIEHGPGHVTGLPMGGGALSQLGLVFGVAFILTEGEESIAGFGQWVRLKVRALRDWLRK